MSSESIRLTLAHKTGRDRTGSSATYRGPAAAGVQDKGSGNDYLVVGTVDRRAWRKEMKQPNDIGELLAHLHDFKEVLAIEYQPAGWYPADEPE